jgi:uncharacterized protein YbaR (Trm112 family)
MRGPAPAPAYAISNMLMCPVCRGKALEADDFGHRLRCSNCGEEYAIIDGIPVMIPTVAQIIDPEIVQLYSDQVIRTEEDGQPEYVGKHTAYIRKNVDLCGKVIVDLGGAEGILTSCLKEADRIVIADLSLPRLCQGAKRKSTRATFICGDIQTAFLNLQTDVVLLMSVLEHIPSARERHSLAQTRWSTHSSGTCLQPATTRNGNLAISQDQGNRHSSGTEGASKSLFHRGNSSTSK